MSSSASTATLDVPRETLAALADFETLLRTENAVHNLVSASSLDHFWSRHVADSAQLIHFVPSDANSWLDLGSGAGFPGLIIALLLKRIKVTLVESRRLRIDFLRQAARLLEVDVEIIGADVAKLPSRPFDVIGARAFAPLNRLLAVGLPFSTPATTWILPKGRNAKSELEAAAASWQGDFRLEPSRTNAEAQIIVASGVRRRLERKRAI